MDFKGASKAIKTATELDQKDHLELLSAYLHYLAAKSNEMGIFEI